MATALGDVFTEVVIAPDFEPEALEILSAKKNLRMMSANAGNAASTCVRSTAASGADRDLGMVATADPSGHNARRPRRSADLVRLAGVQS